MRAKCPLTCGTCPTPVLTCPSSSSSSSSSSNHDDRHHGNSDTNVAGENVGGRSGARMEDEGTHVAVTPTLPVVHAYLEATAQVHRVPSSSAAAASAPLPPPTASTAIGGGFFSNASGAVIGVLFGVTCLVVVVLLLLLGIYGKKRRNSLRTASKAKFAAKLGSHHPFCATGAGAGAEMVAGAGSGSSGFNSKTLKRGIQHAEEGTMSGGAAPPAPAPAPAPAPLPALQARAAATMPSYTLHEATEPGPVAAVYNRSPRSASREQLT